MFSFLLTLIGTKAVGNSYYSLHLSPYLCMYPSILCMHMLLKLSQRVLDDLAYSVPKTDTAP